MSNIHLVTSVPPRIKRLDAQGKDVGSQYQGLCIASWKHAGFAPVSVNSASEIASFPELSRYAKEMDFSLVSVERNAKHITGKPHVFFADLLKQAVIVSGGGVIAITNADILLGKNDTILEKIRKLGAGEFIIGQRIDIQDPSELSGELYGFGFDFFAIHASDIELVSNDIGLIFGMPWWDHYLPIALIGRGLKPVAIDEPFAFHLLHTERWNFDLWQSLGTKFIDAMLPKRLAYLEKAFQPAETNGEISVKRIKPWISHFLNRKRPDLHRVSEANLSFILSIRRGIQ